jgi:hypothetical protein
MADKWAIHEGATKLAHPKGFASVKNNAAQVSRPPHGNIAECCKNAGRDIEKIEDSSANHVKTSVL